MIEVHLIDHTSKPLKTIAAAINQCYSPKTGKELQEDIPTDKAKRLLSIVMSSGHLSTVEHASFTFSISGVSRVTEVQLVRHRMASYSIKSGRYNKTHTDYVIPPVIKNNPKAQEIIERYNQNLDQTINDLKELGFKSEDVRFFTPQGTKTNIVLTMNARELLHFFEKRLCTRAQWEIRMLAVKMLEVVKPICPEIFEHAGPSCETQKICWEGDMNCGKWKAIEGAELKNRI
ncbi:MAG: FAD-dependent thymidylate synthase [Candidatus Gracilibacteria bacterium]|jgi:thymidylate synthase (FAD)|nr:FAD-dependent thymidylate synthase [Candidatus Gracilibacteria bacterium]